MKISNQILAFAGEANIAPYKMFADYYNHFLSLNGKKNVEFQANTTTPEGIVVPITFEEKEEKLKAIINSKYILLKNKQDLNKEEKVKLKEVYKYFKKIKIMHLKKENIRKIYESAKNWEEGLEKIGKWLQQARKIFPESSKTIRNWIGEIISYNEQLIYIQIPYCHKNHVKPNYSNTLVFNLIFNN